MRGDQNITRSLIPRPVPILEQLYHLCLCPVFPGQLCVDGGFDLTQVITAMIRSRREAAKGELNCEGNDSSSSHSDIVYDVAIQYAYEKNAGTGL